MGLIVWTVMCGLGEMAAWLPLSSGFTGYAGRFCDPALGFTLGWWLVFPDIQIIPDPKTDRLSAITLNISFYRPHNLLLPPWSSHTGLKYQPTK